MKNGDLGLLSASVLADRGLGAGNSGHGQIWMHGLIMGMVLVGFVVN